MERFGISRPPVIRLSNEIEKTMKINIDKFRHGGFVVGLTAIVDGDASGKLLGYALESVKTGVMSSVDQAAAKAAKAAGAVEKFERSKLTQEELEAAFKGAKLDGVSEIELTVVGEWVASEGGTETTGKRDAQAAYGFLVGGLIEQSSFDLVMTKIEKQYGEKGIATAKEYRAKAAAALK